jgi:photosystem II stability/assembly factor-like uncharacterized protein
VLAFALFATAAGPVAADRRPAEPSPWNWVDRGPKLLDVSCTAPGRCVAVGEDGAILRSTPGEAPPLSWERVALGPRQDLVSVNCRGALCIAVSGGDGTTAGVSEVLRSEDGGDTWSAPDDLPAATVRGGAKTRVANAVACPPSGPCVIAGAAGGIWRSTDRGKSWSPLSDSSLGLPYRALACPDTGICILVGPGKPVVLQGTAATTIPSPTSGNLKAIACESQSTCTASDSLAHVISISAPWRKWDDSVGLPKDLDAISLACPAADTCVGLSGKGPALRTTSRSSGDWAKRPTGTADLIAVDCAGTICAAVGKAARWYGSGDTGFEWDQVNAVGKFDALDCSGAAGGGTCVAGGKDALGRSSTGGNLWTTPVAASGLDVAAVSCAGFPTCVALSDTRTFATLDAGLTWKNRLPAGSVGHGPEAGTCLNANRCVAVGHGSVFTTFDGAQTGWSIGSIPTDPGESLKSIACPTMATCVVATSEGIYRGRLSVAGGSVNWSWVASDADPSDPLNGIACSSPSSCTAVGFAGQVLRTTDPDLIHWNAKKIGTGPDSDRPPLKAVACPDDGVCIAGGFRGFVATTTNNWATWSLDQIGGTPKPGINAVDCGSPTRCVLVGDTAFSGRR